VESPIVVAIMVFASIYLAFLLIRLFADFFLVAIALGSAVLAYHIHMFYPEFLMVLRESNILSLLKLTLPDQPTDEAIFIIASLITAAAVLISIPILPFSAAYRLMLGVDNPAFAKKEAKVRGWIVEEIERYREHEEESKDGK
jgi:signal transduction histidine kinase